MERCRLAVLVSAAAVAAALLIALLIRRPAIGGILLAVLAVLAVVVFLLVRRRRLRGRSRGENLAGTSASSSADPPDLEHNTDHPAPVKKKKEKPKKKKLSENEAPFDVSSFGPRSFTYEELSIASANFHESRLLGKGGSGHVYRGALPADGSLVAVKCIDHNSSHGIQEFIAEVTIISGLRHRNLVKLRGWCYVSGHVGSGGRRLLLVYDLMPNGSLDHLLFHDDAGGMRLTWPRRLHVLQGLASALQYLHEECESVILHRDVKSSNVMLDEGFNAKLGDFGLSRQVQQGMIAHSTTLAGTRGYLAPELCFGSSKATKETDVYSFGAVLLEVACGKRALDPRIGNAEHVEGLLVDWVWDLHSRGKLLDAVDARLGGQYDLAQMWFVMVLGLACSHPDPKARPTIRHASEALQHATVAAAKLPLPSIPLSKPTPSYYSAGHAASNLSTDSRSTSSDVIS